MLALVVVFLVSKASAVELPKLAEFHIIDASKAEVGRSYAGFNLGRALGNGLVPPCSSTTSGSACSTSSGYHSSQSYTQKLSNWEDVQTYVRANIAVDGFWPDAASQDPVTLVNDSFHFVIGSGVGLKRTSLSNAGALRLSEEAKEVLKQPKWFAWSYGPYFISDVIYGAKFVCAYNIQGYTVEDGAYLRNLFEPISSDVFFDSEMSEAFSDKVEQAIAAKKLKEHPLKCSVQGGPLVPELLVPNPDVSPLALGALFTKWANDLNAEDYLIPLRVELGRIKDLQEVQEALQGMSQAEQAPLNSVQQITSATTAKLEVDYALAAAARSSAEWLLTQECAQADQTLNAALTVLFLDLDTYIWAGLKTTGTEMSVTEESFAKHDYTRLKGSGFFEKYLSLQKSCDATVRL